MLKKLLSTDGRWWAPVPLRIALGLIFMAHGGQKKYCVFLQHVMCNCPADCGKGIYCITTDIRAG